MKDNADFTAGPAGLLFQRIDVQGHRLQMGHVIERESSA
jgi:hypothetical protein